MSGLTDRESRNIDVVLDYASNFQREDSGTLVRRVFHPDAEYLVNLVKEQCPETIDAIPWAGLWRGHDGILRFEDIFERNWTVNEITPADIIAKDDEVIVFGRMVLTARATGKVADTPMMIRFFVEGGRIRRYHLMEDTYGVVLSHRTGGALTIRNNGSERLAPPVRDRETAAAPRAEGPAPDVNSWVQRYFQGTRSGSPERWASAFAADAVVEDPVGTPPKTTPDAILAQGRAFVEAFRDIGLFEEFVHLCGREAVAKWTARGTSPTGEAVTFGGINHFLFDDDGKIRSLRGFFAPPV